MRQGRSLEKLVAHLRRQIPGTGAVLIESPKRLPDKSTGRLCGHDAVLTIVSGSRTFMVAIECRERRRPVGLPQLEAFARKCSATSIMKPVIVSACGFTRTALCQAKDLGVHCLSPEQAWNFPWFRCGTEFRQVRKRYTHIDFTVIPENAFERKPAAYTLVNDDGEAISPEVLKDYLLAVLTRRERSPSDLEPGDDVERIRMSPANLSIIDRDTGIQKRVRQIILVAYSRNEEMELPFLLDEYKDTKVDTSLIELSRFLHGTGLQNVGALKDRGIN